MGLQRGVWRTWLPDRKPETRNRKPETGNWIPRGQGFFTHCDRLPAFLFLVLSLCLSPQDSLDRTCGPPFIASSSCVARICSTVPVLLWTHACRCHVTSVRPGGCIRCSSWNCENSVSQRKEIKARNPDADPLSLSKAGKRFFH